MEKNIKDSIKRHYESPVLLQLGGIGVKTLGTMNIGYDKAGHGPTCMDNGSPSPQDPCYMEYYGS